jgi:hypothetical protein
MGVAGPRSTGRHVLGQVLHLSQHMGKLTTKITSVHLCRSFSPLLRGEPPHATPTLRRSLLCECNLPFAGPGARSVQLLVHR